MSVMASLTSRAAQALATVSTGQPVPSPCVAICKMDVHQAVCEGCLRSIAEITAWGRMADDGKRAVWALLAEREQALFEPAATPQDLP